MLWSVWQKLCRYRQHRTSNTNRAEPIENALMINPIKGCTEINLHDPSLLPTLQCTLQCMGHSKKCIRGTQTFLISKLGGWKQNIAFHKSSKTNRHQALKHLRQYWSYGNWQQRRTVGLSELGDIGLSPASRETNQTNKPQITTLRRGAITSAVLLRKRGNIPNGSVPP